MGGAVLDSLTAGAIRTRMTGRRGGMWAVDAPAAAGGGRVSESPGAGCSP